MFKSSQVPVKKGPSDIFSDFNELYEGFFRPLRWYGSVPGANQPLLDVVEEDKRFLISVEMPGIKKEDIEVALENGVLTIKAEKAEERTEENGGKVIHQERSYGQYLRRFQLGAEIDEANTVASYKDGVLRLELPKKTASEAKKIKVAVH